MAALSSRAYRAGPMTPCLYLCLSGNGFPAPRQRRHDTFFPASEVREP